MKNYELYIFKQGLNKVNLKGSKFTYTVSKNKNNILKELENIESVKDNWENLDEYEKERIQINEEFAKKDEDGKLIKITKSLQSGQDIQVYDIDGLDDPDSEYNKKINDLRDKYKDKLDNYQKNIEDFNEFLKEESKYEPYKVSIDDIPNDISQEEMDLIHWMIEDNK